MGCRTGFYLLVRNADNAKILEITKKILADIVAYDGEVFGNTKKECGNYLDLDLAKAKEELDKAEAEVAEGKEELKNAQESFGQTLAGTVFDQVEGTVLDTADDLKKEVDSILASVEKLRKELGDGETGKALDIIITELKTVSSTLEKEDLTVEELLSITGNLRTIAAQLNILLEKLPDELPEENPEVGSSLSSVRQTLQDLESGLTDLSELLDSVPSILAGLENAIAGLTQAQLEAAVGFATASAQLSNAEAQLAAGKLQYEQAHKQAMDSANLDQLLNIKTLSQLIIAQNFSMPAGYIVDANDNSWLLKVGDEFKDVKELKDVPFPL
jgi:chromosome segregation ATPase